MTAPRFLGEWMVMLPGIEILGEKKREENMIFDPRHNVFELTEEYPGRNIQIFRQLEILVRGP